MYNTDVEAVDAFVAKYKELNAEISKVIIGQEYMVDRLLIGLLGNGHVLLEGVPGLAKTLAIKTLADAVQGNQYLQHVAIGVLRVGLRLLPGCGGLQRCVA